jgi:hypothetical protein
MNFVMLNVGIAQIGIILTDAQNSIRMIESGTGAISLKHDDMYLHPTFIPKTMYQNLYRGFEPIWNININDILNKFDFDKTKNEKYNMVTFKQICQSDLYSITYIYMIYSLRHVFLC